MQLLTEALHNEKQAIERAACLHWFHWMVVALSLVLTFSAWYISKTTIEEKIALQFKEQAQQTVELVAERMQKYEDGLWGGVAAIQTKGGNVSYQDWLIFSNSLQIEKKYPGINGIGVIHYITPENKEAYLVKQRQDRPNYSIHPKHTNNEFWPITYIEPLQANAKAVGLDMAHETNRHTAGLKARDTATAQITGPITLVQDEGQTPGFLFYAPFYKEGVYTKQQRQELFVGMVYAPFVVKKLMEGVLHQEKRHVGIRISDNNEVLYDEHTDTMADYDPNPLFQKSFEVDMYGRTWVFDIRSTLSFRNISANSQPLVILMGGILIDTLLLTLFILLANANQRAIDFVNKVTEQRGPSQ